MSAQGKTAAACGPDGSRLARLDEFRLGALAGLGRMEADDTSRHVEADETMGPASQPRGGWRGASQEASGAGRPCASFSPTYLSQLIPAEVCPTSRLHSSRICLTTG